MQAQRIRAQQHQPPDGALVLAAVERAERHAARPQPGAPLFEIADHLGLRWGPAVLRRLRPVIACLTEERRWLGRDRRHGVNLWALTPAGMAQLAAPGAQAARSRLPESPQHRAWRLARAHVENRIGGIRQEVADEITAIDALLTGDDPPPSDAWLQHAEPVRAALRRMAFATYCLREWAAPTNEHGDVDTDGRRRGVISRRNYRDWDRDHAS